MMRINQTRLAFVLALSLLFCGCAKNLTPSHPNQINAFDGAAYDSLTIVQASLKQASLAAEAPALSKFKPQVNDAILAYNAALASYKVYHAAAGTPTADQATALQAQLSALTAQVAALLSALGVKI